MDLARMNLVKPDGDGNGEALPSRPPAARAAVPAEVPFLAQLSHELRSPVTATVGLIELALTQPLSPQVRDWLETACDSSRGLLELLEKSLDFFDARSAGQDAERVPFNVRQLVEKTAKCMQPLAKRKGLRLVSDVEPEIPEQLLGDPLRLQQVLLNLLTNAIKFTPAGQVSLRAAVQARAAHSVQLEFRVIDTGIGIPPEAQQRIFLPFVRLQARGGERGSGLGLAIAQGLAESMGGRITVTSQCGTGSEFCVQLPCGIPGGEPTVPVAPGPATATSDRTTDSASA